MGRASIQIVGPTPCDLNYNIATTQTVPDGTLLGAQNPKFLRLVNKVFRVILRWDPLYGFGLAKIGEKNQRSRVAQPTGKLTQSNPILHGTEHQNKSQEEQLGLTLLLRKIDGVLLGPETHA